MPGASVDNERAALFLRNDASRSERAGSMMCARGSLSAPFVPHAAALLALPLPLGLLPTLPEVDAGTAAPLVSAMSRETRQGCDVEGLTVGRRSAGPRARR